MTPTERSIAERRATRSTQKAPKRYRALQLVGAVYRYLGSFILVVGLIGGVLGLIASITGDDPEGIGVAVAIAVGAVVVAMPMFVADDVAAWLVNTDEEARRTNQLLEQLLEEERTARPL